MGRPWTKAKLGQLALEVRGELGLGCNQPLDPYQLADHYGIPVYSAWIHRRPNSWPVGAGLKRVVGVLEA